MAPGNLGEDHDDDIFFPYVGKNSFQNAQNAQNAQNITNNNKYKYIYTINGKNKHQTPNGNFCAFWILPILKRTETHRIIIYENNLKTKLIGKSRKSKTHKRTEFK